MILKIIILMALTLKSLRSSLVMDGFYQSTIYVSNYCPSMRHCKEGSHVMCMYYDEHNKVGPRCHDYVDTDMTPEMVEHILQISNSIRSNLASGNETGKDNMALPRAYGMKRLGWDSELATFAQVLANQCLGGLMDQCRATKKFSNPSQGSAVINFQAPDWSYLSRNSTEVGLTQNKLKFVFQRVFNSWQSAKNELTKEMIINCPPMEKIPNLALRRYLNVINADTTHVGCGMSAYKRYNPGESYGKQTIYNSVEVICNFSHSPQPSQPLFMTDPPIPDTIYTEECGCSEGFRETDGCLCEEIEGYVWSTTSTVPAFITPESTNKKLRGPKLIAADEMDSDTMEDQHLGGYKVKSYAEPHIKLKVKGATHHEIAQTRPTYAFLPIFAIEEGHESKHHTSSESSASLERPSHKYMNMTFLSREKIENDSSNEKFKKKKTSKSKSKKSNAESRQVKNSGPSESAVNAQIRKLIRQSLKKASKKSESSESIDKEFANKYFQLKKEDKTSTETNTVEHDENSKPKDDSGIDDEININIKKKVDEHNLMAVLEILERKVTNIDLTVAEKELFDAKMRKIYKAVLNKQQNMQANQQIISSIPNDIESEFQDLKNFIKHKSNYIMSKKKVRPEYLPKVVKKLSTKSINNKRFVKKDRSIENGGRDASIDDKLIEILSRKHNEINNLYKKYNYDTTDINSYSNRLFIEGADRKYRDIVPKETNNFDQIYDDIEDHEYSKVPFRKQVTLAKYDENITNENVINSFEETEDKILHKYNKKIAVLENENLSEDEVLIQRRNQNAIKTPETRRYSYFEKPEISLRPLNTLAMRQLNEYESGRPIRRLQLEQVARTKSRLQQQPNSYLFTNRATF